LGLVTDDLGDEWTQEDEDAILAIWDESPEKQLRLDAQQYACYLTLWKYSVRILNSSPTWIISPLCNLRYQAIGNNAAAAKGEIPSKNFCDSLASLITHHCHGSRAEQLIMLLQYAVICRLDDRRYFVPSIRDSVNECPALKLLYDNLDTLGSQLPNPLHSMHTSARRRTLSSGETPSGWSDLLHHVGETVLAKQGSRPPIMPEEFLTQLGVNVLPLTRWDLLAIIEAVDTMNFHVPGDRYTVDEACRSFKVELKGYDIPSRHQLPEIFELTFKDMLKCVRMAFKPDTDPSSQGDADPQMDQENEPESESQHPDDYLMGSNEVGEVIDSPDIRPEPDLSSDPESSPEPDSGARSASGEGFTSPVAQRVLRPSGRLYDLVLSSPSHGSSNSYPIRTRESSGLSVRRVDEIESLIERIQELEESTDRDRETIWGLREENSQFRQELQDQKAEFEELRKQGAKNTQVLQRLEQQNRELIQELKDQNTQFTKALEEQNTNLLVRLQSSNSHGAATRAASPELGTLP
jgi:hypothetical protein